MKRLTKTFIFLTLVSGHLLANEDRFNTEVIKEYELDANTVYSIPIGNTPTTITFPGPLSSIDGANISNNPSNEAPVLLNYVQGRYFFTIRAAKPNAQAAVNAVYKNQTYALNFYHREDSVPYRSVRLLNKEDTSPLSGASSTQTRLSRKISPSVLVGILDRTKSYHIIEANYAGKLADIEQFYPKSLVTDFKDFSVTVDEIFRFKEYDTLVFKIHLQNKTEDNIFYQPQSVAIRIADNLYFPSISDASGIIPAHSNSIAYIAITGKPNGERADLSLRNHFQVIVTKIHDPAKVIIP